MDILFKVLKSLHIVYIVNANVCRR